VAPSVPVVVDRGAGGVATITIANPSKRNALPVEGWRLIPSLLADLDADPSVWVIVLTGEGDHFSSGLDLSSLGDDAATISAAEIGAVTAPAEAALIACSKPVIARIRGYCVGGGVLLAAACDLRVAASDAQLGITPAKLGIVYPQPSIDRLVALTSPGFAKRMLLTAEIVPVARAAAAGLVDDVVDPTELDAAVDALIERMRPLSKLTISAAKQMIDGTAAVDWPALSRSSGEQAEGVAAFLAHRPPTFPWAP